MAVGFFHTDTIRNEGGSKRGGGMKQEEVSKYIICMNILCFILTDFMEMSGLL